MKLPKISGQRGTPAGPGERQVAPITAVSDAVGQLGEELGATARKLSAQELRNARFDAALRAREDKAHRNAALRGSLFGLREDANAIQESFQDDPEPFSMAKRTKSTLDKAVAHRSNAITNEEDKQKFALQAQALSQGLVNSARTIGIQKQRDLGLADGLALQDEVLSKFSADPSIDDSEFAGGVDVIHQHYTDLEKAGVITKVERQRSNDAFDDKLGGIVQQQDETLAVESGSHFLMLKHLLRVQNGFYKLAPETIPTVMEQAIKRQSTFLHNQELKEAKRATLNEKRFSIALDLGDKEAASELLGRPVTAAEMEHNLVGLVQEGFRSGLVNDPAVVNAAEQEVVDNNHEILDVDKAKFTELLIKTTRTSEVDNLIEELIDPSMVRAWNMIEGGAAARRELLKEAAARKDKLIASAKSGDTASDQILKKEIQLAEKSLDAKKESGTFGAFGTKATNEKIAFMKRILHLRVQQGEKPFAALKAIEDQFDKSPAKASVGGVGEIAERIPFGARQSFLSKTAALTANEFDDQELKELVNFRNKFINKTKQFVQVAEDEEAALIEKEDKRRRDEENSFFNFLGK